jgi:hypothetical protein
MRAPWTGPGQEEAIYRQADAAAKVRDVWPDAETAHYGADGALTGVTDARGTRCAGPDAGGVKGMRVDPACFQRWGERIAAARAGADGRGWELNVPEALAVMHIHQARKLRLGVG